MNFLNRFSHLEDNDYYECNEGVNSFKPAMKKTTNLKATVQTPEFKLTQELFPSLTKSVKTVPVEASLSFSKIITTHENENENIEVLPIKEEQPSNMREVVSYVFLIRKRVYSACQR